MLFQRHAMYTLYVLPQTHLFGTDYVEVPLKQAFGTHWQQLNYVQNVLLAS